MARRKLSAIYVALTAVLFLSSSGLCAEDWDEGASKPASSSEAHTKAVAEESDDTEQWEDAEDTEASAKPAKSKSKPKEKSEPESASAASSDDESKSEKSNTKADNVESAKDAEKDDADEVVKDPKKRKREKIEFDLKTATNLDDIEADEGNLRTFSQKVSDEPKKSFDELQQDRQKSLVEAGIQGALRGAGWGLYGVVGVLVLFGIGKLVLRKTGAEQSASRGRGSATLQPSNSKNELYLVAGGAVLSMLIGISFGAVPMMMESMDTHKKVFEKTIKEKPPIQYEQVYSKLFELQSLMPEGFRKIRIEFPAAPLSIVSTKGYDTSRHDKPDPLPLEYWCCVYEDKRNGMALGYAKLPPISQDEDDTSRGWVTVFDTNLALDAAVKGACEAVGGKPTFVIPIGLDDKHPGREIEGHLDEGLKDSGVFRERIYTTQKGNYLSAVVWGEPKFVNSNQSYKFLDSLSIPGSEKEEKTVAKDSSKRLSEEDEIRFLQKAANAIQTNLDLTDAYPTNLDGTLRVTKMVVGIDPEGKVSKMDLKTVFEESDHEKLAKALTKAVTNSSPFSDVPEFPGTQFLFRLKLVGDKIQVLSSNRKGAPIEAQVGEDESLTSEDKPADSEKPKSSSDE